MADDGWSSRDSDGSWSAPPGDHRQSDEAPGGPPRWQLLLVGGIAVGVIALVWVGVAALLGDRNTPVAPAVVSGPTEAATAPTEATEQPSDLVQDDGARRVNVRALARQVAELRELPLQRRLRTEVRTEAALADKVSELAFEETDDEEIEDTQRLLVALRLASAGVDLAATMEALYREQVLGLYVPKERTLYVRAQTGRSPLQRVTTVHEITHALQDQSFDLVRLQKDAEDDAEASLAMLSLIEGDAVLTQQLWAMQRLSVEEQQEIIRESSGGGEALAEAPEYLRASLFFPYEQGVQFVAELYGNGGFAAVNAAFEDPPTTSEQIMHPERYLERDDPVDISVAGRPGGGWQEGATYPFGEFDLQQMLQATGSGTADAAAHGWGGGEIRSWERGARTAVGAALAFDTAGDAAQACDAVRRWYAEVAGAAETGEGTFAGDVDHLAVVCSDVEVRFGLAPTSSTARLLAAAP